MKLIKREEIDTIKSCRHIFISALIYSKFLEEEAIKEKTINCIFVNSLIPKI